MIFGSMEVRRVPNMGIVFGLNQISRDMNTNVRNIVMSTLNDVSVSAAAAALHEENTMTVIIMGGKSVANMGVVLRPTEV